MATFGDLGPLRAAFAAQTGQARLDQENMILNLIMGNQRRFSDRMREDELLSKEDKRQKKTRNTATGLSIAAIITDIVAPYLSPFLRGGNVVNQRAGQKSAASTALQLQAGGGGANTAGGGPRFGGGFLQNQSVQSL